MSDPGRFIRREIREEEAAALKGSTVGARERARRRDVREEGTRAIREGDYSLARRKFQAIHAGEPADPTLLLAIGHCFLMEGEPARALEFYERHEKASPGEPACGWGTGKALVQVGRPMEALPYLESCFHEPVRLEESEPVLALIFPSSREFLCDIALTIADIQKGNGERDGQRQWLQAALREDPECLAAHRRLADLLLRERNSQEAIAHLEFILDNSTEQQELMTSHNNMAIALYDSGQRNDAIRHLTRVLESDPANSTAIHNLNYIYEREGTDDPSTGRAASDLRFGDVLSGGLPIFGLEDASSTTRGDAPVVIGKSGAMMKVMRHARVAATNDSPVLIWGESGTGKELLARVIRMNSPRCNEPFEVVQCESLSDLELESELFGHEKGAFTGARTRRLGGLEKARGGTVFIEEVTALSPLLQGKLLRALNEGLYIPLGSQHPVEVHARVVAATIHDPRVLVREGRLRDDLYYKLNVIPIHVPPLRERREDIQLLAEYFLARHARQHKGRVPTLPREDLTLLMDYEWPGNVRELENLVERAIVMGSQSGVFTEELARLRRARGGGAGPGRGEAPSLVGGDVTLAELERRHIEAVLKRCGGSQSQAARILGVNPSTLWRKMKAWKSRS